ncbi:uncharacterized protein LOC131207884 [Anopheles bellator]|uniref:uncharacterized protein LOC131207884 n=1 Tax=Anopheles bellator TaxID=139047 RepID=UPI00264A0820|nr:uncharacterized protein LOC131207884 [Anopheles bellator]
MKHRGAFFFSALPVLALVSLVLAAGVSVGEPTDAPEDVGEGLLLTTGAVAVTTSPGVAASPSAAPVAPVESAVSTPSPQPTVENSPPDVSPSSSPSSPSASLTPSAANVPGRDVSSTPLSTFVPSSSLAPDTLAPLSSSSSVPPPSSSAEVAPLMASSTIVSSGQTGPVLPSGGSGTEATADTPAEHPTTEGSGPEATVVASAAHDDDGEDEAKKPAADLAEPESETPVFSFGIRLFTVEVVTGTERASQEEQIEPTNGTQAENVTLHEVGVEPSHESTLQSATVQEAMTTTTTGAPVAVDSEQVASVEPQDELAVVPVAPTGSDQQATVTVNTQVTAMDNARHEPLEPLESDVPEDGFSNEIHVERNLKNGLYRIKIAEITTDEFDNGLREHDNEAMLLTDSMGARLHLPPSQALHKSVYPSKINIDDFYPSKLEDFKEQPLQRQQSNTIQEPEAEKVLREKAILRNEDSERLFESTIVKPSDVLPVLTTTAEVDEKLTEEDVTGPDGGDISTTKIEIELIDDTSETSTSDERASSKPTTDNITERLEENDEVISRIEENFKGFRQFEGTVAGDDDDEYRDAMVGAPAVVATEEEPRKDDEVITIAISSVTFSSSQQDTTQTPATSPSALPEDLGVPVSGSDIVKADGYGNLFIPRRVKKNDPATATKLAQLAKTQAPLRKIDFAATKFNTDNSAPGGGAGGAQDLLGVGGKKDKPEFSTTKFYNSKELYSELHHHPQQPANRTGPVGLKPKPGAAILSEKDIISAKTLSKPANPSSAVPPGGSASYGRKSAKPLATLELKQHTLKTNFVLNEDPLATAKAQQSATVDGPVEPQGKIKSLGSAASAIIAATAKLAKPVRPPATTTTTTAKSTPVATVTSSSGSGQGAENLITRPTGAPLSRLHEKINTLDCEIQTIAPDSSVWRGNETHELELPVTTPEDCSAGSSCTPTTISWEGTADIQSGDVLIVEIDDHHLIPSNYNKSSEGAHHTTAAVYQVTRLGHENCDITEGVLLDITPLVADGKKLVTLYDKDLTEGINLLIVVSEQWGQQCVRLKVTVKSDNCGENADCSGKGVCYSNNSMEGYECQCCSGFAGTHCEEIDACSPSPCTNNGICVDLSQGHEGNAYQCLCPYGYTGKNCQFESDPCNPSQCLNGGTCVGNSTHFRCDCTSGYTGPLCQHNLNECESSPCVHGICVDQEDGFRCFCQPGFSGELCNFEYNECESNPCINGGQCIDNIGGFSCKCTRGYTGKRCHIKVDFCANDPCPDGHRCIDHGDDFTCECPGGRNGPDCNQVPRTLCNVNPCANGGTCWTTEESFYCACRPGFTGKMCEENFVIDTMVSSSEMLSDTLANQNGLRAISGSTMYGAGGGSEGDGEGDGGVTHTGTGKQHSSAIELHNAYIAAGTLATAILIVAIVVTACHCKVHQSYRHFATKHRQLIPVFGRRSKPANGANRHWLSGKGHQHHQSHTNPNYHYAAHQGLQPHSYAGLQPERMITKPLPMNLENDMYYTVDFGDSQNAPLIQ